MNVAIIGYGKMGKNIEKVLLEGKHNVALIIDTKNENDFNKAHFANIDVAIEFTNPEVAKNNIKRCIDFGVPVVSGSTGWNVTEMEKYCKENNGSLLISSNFSIGVNIFFNITKYVSTLMNKFKDYHISIQEIHHTEKKDSPSGTAISVAELILKNSDEKNKWVNHFTLLKNELGIDSKRIKDVVGAHTVKYENEIDVLAFTHSAKSRQGFALGAVLAAEYIYNKRGVFYMSDVLKIN